MQMWIFLGAVQTRGGKQCEIWKERKGGLGRNPFISFSFFKLSRANSDYDMTKCYLQILLNVTLILVLSYFSSSSYIFNKVLKRH